MRHFGVILLLAVGSWLLASCENTTWQSSVPTYPVRATIDTRAVFIDFTPENTNAYITINEEGYKENGRFVLPVTVTDAWGYGGLLVYVSLNGYVAFDLACPNCAAHGLKRPCSIDGMYAVCPECGEQYEVLSGYAVPQKGISHEALRQYNIIRSDGKLNISQK